MARNRAVVVITAGVLALAVAIVVLWSKGAGGSTSAFCSSLRSGENPVDVFDRYDPSAVDASNADVHRGVQRLQELERAAPGSIDDDLKVLVQVAQQLDRALDPANKDQPVPDLSAELDRVRAASAEVTRFAADSCGVTLEPPGSAPASSTPSTVTPTT